MAFSLEGLDTQPTCISSPNLEKLVKIRSRPFSRSLLLSNTNVSLSTYIMQNNSKVSPELKDIGLWLTIWTVERGELLCSDNVVFLSPLFVYYLYIVLENSMTRNRKRTRAMISPLLSPTLKGMKVSIFSISSITTLFFKILRLYRKSGEELHIYLGCKSGVFDWRCRKLLPDLTTQPNLISCVCAIGVIRSLR